MVGVGLFDSFRRKGKGASRPGTLRKSSSADVSHLESWAEVRRGVEAFVELPPAGTLSGLVRREIKGVKTVALKTPADLDKVTELLGSDE